MNPVITAAWFSMQNNNQYSGSGSISPIALAIIVLVAIYGVYIMDVFFERSCDKDMFKILHRTEDDEEYPLANKKYFIKCLCIPFYLWGVSISKLFED